MPRYAPGSDRGGLCQLRRVRHRDRDDRPRRVEAQLGMYPLLDIRLLEAGFKPLLPVTEKDVFQFCERLRGREADLIYTEGRRGFHDLLL